MGPTNPPEEVLSLPGLTEDCAATYSAPRSESDPEQLRTMEALSIPRLSVRTDGAGAEVRAGADGLGIPVEHFRLRRLVGRGGMGEVWEAEQVALDRIVAVKRLLRRGNQWSGGDPSRPEETALEFHQEALIAAGLEHPAIVPVYDLGEDEHGQTLLAMRFIRGEPWHKILRRDWDALNVSDYLTRHLPILVTVCQAVAYAHSRGVVHRDIKPSQVMIGDYGEVLLTDWGLAICYHGDRHLQEERRGMPMPTPATATCPAGTPAMMAPEQTRSTARDIGPWTDIYQLGGTLYCLLTGSYPHRADTAEKAIARAAKGVVEHPLERCPGREMPEELVRITLRALAAESTDRHASVLAFLGELRDFLEGTGRRRESHAITARIAEERRADSADYARLLQWQKDLDQARTLWVENPATASLADAMAEEFARQAIAGGDLALARLQGNAVKDAARRSELLDAVSSAEQVRRAQGRQRRVALAATVLLLAAVAIGSLIFNANMREANRRTLAERDRAISARANADKVVRFLINDLREKLVPTGNVDVLDEGIEQADNYYRTLDAEELDVEELEALVDGYRSLSVTFGALGRNRDAVTAGEAGLKVVQQLQQQRPEDPSYLRLRSAMLKSLSAHHKTGGRKQEADRVELLAIATAREALALDPSSLASTEELASLMLSRAHSMGADQRFESAEEVLQEAGAILARVAQLRPDGLPPSLQSELDASHSMIASQSRRLPEAIEQSLASFLSSREQHERSPDDKNQELMMTVQGGRTADLLREFGDLEGARQIMDEIMPMARDSFARDPTNISSVQVLGLTLNQEGKLLADEGRRPEAIARYLEAAERMKGALELSREEMVVFQIIVLTQLHAAKNHLILSEPEAALSLARDTAIYVEELHRMTGNTPFLDVVINTQRNHEATALFRLGHQEEAIALTEIIRADPKGQISYDVMDAATAAGVDLGIEDDRPRQTEPDREALPAGAGS